MNNELREIHNIEMTDKEKTILAGSYLLNKITEIEDSLKLNSNTEIRIQLLKAKASYEYALMALYDELSGEI